MRIILVLTVVILGGCSQVREFTPTSGNTFTFSTDAAGDTLLVSSSIRPEDPQAEAKRISALEKDIKEQGMCPNGYTIKSRDVAIKHGDIQFYDTYKIYYTGECITPGSETGPESASDK